MNLTKKETNQILEYFDDYTSEGHCGRLSIGMAMEDVVGRKRATIENGDHIKSLIV